MIYPPITRNTLPALVWKVSLLPIENNSLSAILFFSMMTREKLLKRISVNPDICFGKPCIKGHRIWVSLILDILASGMSIEEIHKDYPSLAEEDILACIAYGAEMARDRYIEIAAP